MDWWKGECGRISWCVKRYRVWATLSSDMGGEEGLTRPVQHIIGPLRCIDELPESTTPAGVALLALLHLMNSQLANRPVFDRAEDV